MPKQDPVELKSPISTSTTLKKLGMPVDYVFTGNDLLQVTGTAVLTIEPGVTIQFANTGRRGGLRITSSATIKATGTAGERIRFIGAVEAAGSWQGITVESKTDNRFDYCDFLNMGNSSRTDYGGMQLTGAKVGISHCKFTNGLGTGLRAMAGSSYSEFSAFDNNVFEGYENEPPVILMQDHSLSMLEKFDMTSDFTRNAKQYIQISPNITKDVTLNQTTVPYYFSSGIWSEIGGYLNNVLTINEGVTIYMANDIFFNYGDPTDGRLMINGTASKKVKFTRLPGTSGYWNCIHFNGLKGSVINHCIFEYGGSSSEFGTLFLYSRTELTLNNVEINNSNNYGVYLFNGPNYKLTHSNVTFSNNRLGNVYMDNWPNSGVLSHFP
jgi:hypothetical protein